ncbi:MAG: hypothetical protein ACK5WZ_08725 [Pseudobdellovibrionaceae bacterium]
MTFQASRLSIFLPFSVFLFTVSGFGQTPKTPGNPTAIEETTTQGALIVEPEKPALVPAKKNVESQKVSATKQSTNDEQYGFHFSAGFPSGYGAGLDYQTADLQWGFGAEVSGFSLKSGTAPEVKAALSQIKISGRYHPWAGSFYTGLHLGAQTTTFEGTDTYLGQKLTAKMEIKNNFLTPHIGWQWIFDSGILLGFELGAQVNTGAKTNLTEPTTNTLILEDASYKEDKKKIEDEAKKFGESTLPHLILLRLGYMF